MKHPLKLFSFVGVLGLAVTWTACGEEATPPAEASEVEKTTTPTAVDIAAVDEPTDLQLLLRDFRLQRAEFILARERLRQQLIAATTEEERRAVLREYAELNRERLREQAELRRDLKRRQMEIRRERRQRQGQGG
jgi:hypothetical protein